MTNAEAIAALGQFLSHDGKLIYKTSKTKKKVVKK